MSLPGSRALAALKARPADELSFFEKLRLKVGMGMAYARFKHLFILYANEYKKTLTDEQKVQFDKVWGQHK